MKKYKITLLALSTLFLTTNVNGIISANEVSSNNTKSVESSFFKGVKQPKITEKEQQKENAKALYDFYTKQMNFTKEGAIGAIAVGYNESKLISDSKSETGNVGLYSFTGKAKRELQKNNPANMTLITNQINLIQERLVKDQKTKSEHNYVAKLKKSKSEIKSAELFNKGFEKSPTTNKAQLQKSIKQVKKLLN